MKKVFVLALTALSTFALTGCEMIEGLLQNGQDLLNDKKDYSYDDYVVLLADKNFSWDYTSCTATFEIDGKKSITEYTYNKEDKLWHYTTTKTVLGEEVEEDSTTDLGIVHYVKSCKTTAALLNKSVDSLYKFSASKVGYTITCTYKDDSQQVEGEYTFTENGLFSVSNEKKTDLKSVEATTRKVSYSYKQSLK